MCFVRLILLAALASTPCAFADTFPTGGYLFDAHRGTGIHLSEGSLGGYIVFDAAHTATAANIVYTDADTSISYTFTLVGPTTYDAGSHTLSATITDALMPSYFYYFSVRIPGQANDSFVLSCGVDCDTYVSLPGLENDYEEFAGTIRPAPEPSSLILLGTGALGFAQAVRRRIGTR
ncbi:MAG: PEP-CTERM sorting domain-containing protein [Acidobacteriota bacterium]|nr:PEP-CTERM sorting domain-containing protein [Acidobacteriota bacterium]